MQRVKKDITSHSVKFDQCNYDLSMLLRKGKNMRKNTLAIVPIIHPWEVYSLIQLKEKFGVSDKTIRNWMDDGLKSKKLNSMTYFTGQNILNYFNQESTIYSEEIILKVFEKTGVTLKS